MFADDRRSQLKEWGRGAVVRNGSCRAALQLENAMEHNVYALDCSGRRIREVPCQRAEEGLRFCSRVECDPAHATVFYEIVRRKKE